MTPKTALIGSILSILIIGSHVVFHNSLISFVIAPLVFATWFALAPTPPEWGIVSLVILTELFSSSVPGALAVAILLPLAARPLKRKIQSVLSPTFFALIVGITAMQYITIILLNSFSLRNLVFPLPAAVFSIAGSSLAAFLVCVVWYEFVVGFSTR